MSTAAAAHGIGTETIDSCVLRETHSVEKPDLPILDGCLIGCHFYDPCLLRQTPAPAASPIVEAWYLGQLNARADLPINVAIRMIRMGRQAQPHDFVPVRVRVLSQKRIEAIIERPSPRDV